jgi:hypothetical protein
MKKRSVSRELGRMKHLFDRYKSILGYTQFPLLDYTAIVSTLNYIPAFRGYMTEFLIVGAVLFFFASVVLIYLDYKYVLPAERTFMFEQTPFLNKRFDSIEEKINGLSERIKGKCGSDTTGG